jgi:mlo protein
VQIVLIVGMKLQLIILEMVSEIEGSQLVVKGTPVVQPTNKLFWFGHPQLVLSLIHFILFQVSNWFALSNCTS